MIMRRAGAHPPSGHMSSKAGFRKINHCSLGPLFSALVLVNAALGDSLKKTLQRDKSLSEFWVQKRNLYFINNWLVCVCNGFTILLLGRKNGTNSQEFWNRRLICDWKKVWFWMCYLAWWNEVPPCGSRDPPLCDNWKQRPSSYMCKEV